MLEICAASQILFELRRLVPTAGTDALQQSLAGRGEDRDVGVSLAAKDGSVLKSGCERQASDASSAERGICCLCGLHGKGRSLTGRGRNDLFIEV